MNRLVQVAKSIPNNKDMGRSIVLRIRGRMPVQLRDRWEITPYVLRSLGYSFDDDAAVDSVLHTNDGRVLMNFTQIGGWEFAE